MQKNKEDNMEIYKQNIINYNGNPNVIKNMLLSSAIHDTAHRTNFCEQLEQWLKENGYEF